MLGTFFFRRRQEGGKFTAKRRNLFTCWLSCMLPIASLVVSIITVLFELISILIIVVVCHSAAVVVVGVLRSHNTLLINHSSVEFKSRPLRYVFWNE